MIVFCIFALALLQPVRPEPETALQLDPVDAKESVNHFGVEVAIPLYAVVPRLDSGSTNATVALTVWMRRVGGEGPFKLPHQRQDAVRLLVWVDLPEDLHLRQFGHVVLPVHPEAWHPRLFLEMPAPGPVLEAVFDTGPAQLSKVSGALLRPLSYRVDLPPESGDCFKLFEASYPGHKSILCLPRDERVCEALAPADRFTDTAPALWLGIGPIRRTDSPRNWDNYYAETAARVAHYLAYHIRVGVSGLLLYADVLSRSYLRKNEGVVALLKAGRLRFVHWELPERSHKETDGRGRVLGYNYDQALFASHALLGLSACGANLALLITDIDEFLYPVDGKPWPHPMASCMPQRRRTDGAEASGVAPIAQYVVRRFNLLSTRVPRVQQPALWSAPLTPAYVASLVREEGGLSQEHPIRLCNLIAQEPFAHEHSKRIMIPAAEVVSFFVHEGVGLRGTTGDVPPECMRILHVLDIQRHRSSAANMSKFIDFQLSI